MPCGFKPLTLAFACWMASLAYGDRAPEPETPEAAAEQPVYPPAVLHAMSGIRAADIRPIIDRLCARELAGRAAGQAGARAAADYIAGQFRRFGLRPGGSAGSYFQTFKIRPGYQIESSLEIHGDGVAAAPFKRGKNYMPVHIPQDDSNADTACVLAGYGITSKTFGFDEYRDLDVKDKAVLVFSGVPWGMATDGWIRKVERQSFDTLSYKARNAAEHGASMLLILENPMGWRRLVSSSEQLRLPDRDFPMDSPIPVVQITRATAEKITGIPARDLKLLALDISQTRTPQSRDLGEVRLKYQASMTGRAVIGRNVVGIVPGADPTLQGEAIVIGAHYDHLGETASGTFFGANDNASGVSALLEIAQAYQLTRPGPKRSIIFIAFGAEEIGKIGSTHYVSRPSVPLEQTVLMINFDMIGRNEPDEVMAVATRSSAELHLIHQLANQEVGLKIEHPEDFRLGRSDHTAFYLAGVPVMYLFGGLHPGYHSPQDTPDKLRYDKIERVARLAYLTSWLVAERPSRITYSHGQPSIFSP